MRENTPPENITTEKHTCVRFRASVDANEGGSSDDEYDETGCSSDEPRDSDVAAPVDCDEDDEDDDEEEDDEEDEDEDEAAGS
jgi:hypothetical protein